jgi:hypothetical protein
MYKTREQVLKNYPCIYNTIEDMKAQSWDFEDESFVLEYFRKDSFFLKHLRIEKIRVVLNEREEFKEDDLLHEFIKELLHLTMKIN